MPLAVLIGLIILPVILLFLLQVNAAMVFLSLCLGDVLLQFVGDDAVSIASGASTSASLTDSTVRLILLLLPAVLTILFMLKTLKRSQKLLNILPSLGTGLLVALLVVPLLPPDLSSNITSQAIWANSKNLQSFIVTASAVVCLFFLWLNRPKHGSEKEGKKKHKG